jgi:putative PIN family toxin of toxin-antitoxin system
VKVVIDTNVLISAFLFGGKPRQILQLVLNKEIEGITSLILLAELLDVLAKKFNFPQGKLRLIDGKIKKSFRVVYPTKHLRILKDEADNRVLEAAFEGECNFIVTGDQELLELGRHRSIQIITVDQFLKLTETK